MRLFSRKDCPMRHENGNCTAAGGFCTAVNDPICEALHNAFKCGEYSKIEWATLALAKQSTLYEEKRLAVLQKIHEKVTADAEPVIRCKDCKHYQKKGSSPFYDDDSCDILYYIDGSHRTVCEQDFCSYAEPKARDEE